MQKIYLMAIMFFLFITSNAQLKDYVITAYGAKPDGVTNNTAAIQKAIDDAFAAGGGIVVVPRGRFVTGVIHLKSNVELLVHEEAVLLGSFNRADYGPSLKASALIVANNQKNIAIKGKGLIDGQCDLLIDDIYKKLRSGELYDDEWKEFNPWNQRRPSEKNRPRIIEFRNCDGVSIKNIHIQNSSGWVQNYKECSNVKVDSIHVLSNVFWNNDGIDLVDCKNASVTNSFFNVADDGICLKSENRNSRCENIYIANCKVRSSANAVKLGTASYGGFQKIKIRDIEVYDTYRSAIAIESVDGGLMKDIDVRNIHATNTGNAILIRLGHRNKDSVYSKLQNVYIANVKVQVPKTKPDKGYPMEGPELKYPKEYKINTTEKAASVSPWNNSGIDSSAVPYPHNVFPSSITGLPDHAVENVVLENIEITYQGGASKSVNYFPIDSLNKITETPSAYPEFSMFGELPVWAFYVRHVKGITMKNITVKTIEPDFRNAFLFNDVQQLVLDKISIPSKTELPAIILNNIQGKEIKDVSVQGANDKIIKTIHQ